MLAENQEIIIIDDDISVSQSIERLLMVAGWKSRAFSSAEDFLHSSSSEFPCFLILDIQLPGMTGFQLHQHLIAKGREVPVIFITGNDHPFLRRLAEHAGAVAYLTKPFKGEELIQAIREHLKAV